MATNTNTVYAALADARSSYVSSSASNCPNFNSTNAGKVNGIIDIMKNKDIPDVYRYLDYMASTYL